MAATVDFSLDNTHEDPSRRADLVLGGMTYGDITDNVAEIWEAGRPPKIWYVVFGTAVVLLSILGVCLLHLFFMGVGVWGNNNPVYWGFPIVNFVFWVGIGHAGTLISAILFLFRQNWRTSINRAAEAMTIFAVVCAGLFPGVHIGRLWVFYWLFPVPTEHLAMWPNFRSPLLWDVFAVGTYATVSLLFWYMGMVPDIATFRDRSKTKIQKFIYGLLSLGWTGSARNWHRYEMAYTILAALATPLVLSVHTIVSFDFAVSQLPGWHTTIFPPYFVAGAIFSGFAMVVTLLVPCRSLFKLERLITIRHLENMNKIIMATGLMVGTAYGIEFFIAWYGGVEYEKFAFINRAFGNYGISYWIMVTCNVFIPQLFWIRWFRTNLLAMVVISIFVNIGMWFERFVILMSLTRDFLPSSWGNFYPSLVDILMLIGSFGLFFTLFCLFCRYLPIIAISEVKNVSPQTLHHHGHDEHEHHVEHGTAH
ncbi:MAG: polysulfide reductase NrfD [Pirellulaceae bacterium]|nr:polysulfide reductase NrfD [Pirellulaceae bacterium]